ncbi:MAG: tRNA adenosine(34) deaminase TadA [Actinomycetes bacterium]|jgi:tRNA(adenine34) deaminase|nr:tRNA adenosine(34) deaminase TadA [Actinomycetes bacterium]
MNDADYMRLALDAARDAAYHGEVPIGAIVVDGTGAVVATASNRRERNADPTGHAELLAIRDAAHTLERWRLSDCTVYATLEPCPMCAGAMHQARVKRCVYGTPDPKAGALGSLYDLHDDARLNHRFDVASGILADEAAALLQTFFKERRQ